MRIDLNADLGESFGAWTLGDDEAMLEVVTSANVACGFHAGDPRTLQRTVAAAAERGVVVGAQVSYRDLAGFGRRFVDADPADLEADVLYQLGALEAMCRVAGTRVAYLKPHGALYHAVGTHEPQAEAVLRALRRYDARLPLLHQDGSLVSRLAREAGTPVVTEAFADRAYLPDGRLVPRGQPGAVLHDPAEVAVRMVRLAREGRVTSVEGTDVQVPVASICTHGDSPGAVEMARAVRAGLEGAGLEVAPFVRSAPSTPGGG